MLRVLADIPGRGRDESGLTLPELLIATTTMLIVLVSAFGLLQVTGRNQPRVTERVASVQEARVVMERVTRELRQGLGITVSQPHQLVILTYVKRTACGGSAAPSSIPCQVTYSCSAGTCSRSEQDPEGSGGGPAVEVISGLADSNVFSYLPSAAQPDYVGVRLELPARDGDDAVTLDDGVALRNAGAS